MSARLIDVRTLRTPPVPGRYYLMPTVHYYWNGIVRDWPVTGPCHTDKDIGFPWVHFHIDPRFIPSRFARYELPQRHHPSSKINARPLSEFSGTVAQHGPMPRTPTLKRVRCRTAKHAWLAGDPPESWGMKRRYGWPAQAIQRPDGRQLCPHRKVDLTQHPADALGRVVCPLHGLLVQCQSRSSLELGELAA